MKGFHTLSDIFPILLKYNIKRIERDAHLSRILYMSPLQEESDLSSYKKNPKTNYFFINFASTIIWEEEISRPNAGWHLCRAAEYEETRKCKEKRRIAQKRNTFQKTRENADEDNDFACTRRKFLLFHRVFGKFCYFSNKNIKLSCIT